MGRKFDVLQDFKGSPDGYTVIQYTKGQKEIELEEELAKVALAEKWVKSSKAAKADDEEKTRQEAEEKAKQEAEARQANIAALQSELDQLHAELAAVKAAAGDTAPIVAQIEAKQAELAAL
ncbi:MAG: hypothetical protein OEV35_10170 [Gallionellaceae bacterium]|nr:hypothetical protein [Gallionellaceae bacterium]